MCIICNLKDPQRDVGAATDFLDAYERSQSAMQAAAAAMLTVSKLDLEPEDRKRYDAAFKQMRRVMRDWNRIEHTRENAALEAASQRPVEVIAMGESTHLEPGIIGTHEGGGRPGYGFAPAWNGGNMDQGD